jgi:DNA-binding phage protein
MQVNIMKLKGKIVENGTTLEAIADTIGINRSTLYRKLKNGGVSLTIGEAHKLVSAVPLSREEAADIFLCQ